MSPPDRIRIVHLYPRHMSLYGDLGNVITLAYRLRARGLEAEVIQVNPGDRPDLTQADLLFMGGGQDRGQKLVAPHLQELGEDIRSLVAGGLPALVICGGFQLFAHYFRTVDGDELPGIGVFPGYTLGGTRRCIGNAVVDVTELFATWGEYSSRANPSAPSPRPPAMPPAADERRVTLVGFENHSGLTYLEPSTRTLGPLVVGYGNVGDGSGEGAIVHNAVGTYLHGPILPKNPHLADRLLLAAVRRRRGPEATLPPLDDTVEWRAHDAAVVRAHIARTSHLFQS